MKLKVWLLLPLFIFLGNLGAEELDLAQAEKKIEAKKFIETFGYKARYLVNRQGYLAELAKDTKISAPFKAALIEATESYDFEERLIYVVGQLLTKDDLIKINAFTARGAGLKQAVLISELARKIEHGEIKITEISEYRDRFYAALSDEERKSIADFTDSPSGQRFWNSHNLIAEKLPVIWREAFKVSSDKARLVTRELEKAAP